MASTLDPKSIINAAELLVAATQNGAARERLTGQFPQMSLDDAYAVQRAGQKMRERMGAELVGWKMGLTSEAKRKQMSLDSAIFGYLHDKGEVSGASLSLQGLIHPKIEPEIGFRMKHDLRGRVSLEEAIAAIGSVCAAFEIIDSRYVGFKYFSLPDVVADNCSAALYKFGPEEAKVSAIALDRLKMELVVNGTVVESALSSEISGHPAQSIVQLAAMLDAHGEGLKAGQLVLAGAATPAFALERGQKIELRVDGLPPAQLVIEG
jgi:2-oxo-3-hexenedioate decarboxylase